MLAIAITDIASTVMLLVSAPNHTVATMVASVWSFACVVYLNAMLSPKHMSHRHYDFLQLATQVRPTQLGSRYLASVCGPQAMVTTIAPIAAIRPVII